MTITESQQVNAEAICRDYLDGLNAAEDEQALELREPLTEHVRTLVLAVQSRMPHMGPASRAQAGLCLTRAAETLNETPAPCLAHTHDLAVSARALLELYRHPGASE